MHLTACWYYYNSMHKHVDKAIILPDTFLTAVKQRQIKGWEDSSICTVSRSQLYKHLVSDKLSSKFGVPIPANKRQESEEYCLL